MYKNKVFNTFYELTKFLNDNNILPSEIISISTVSIGVVVVYFDADQESGNGKV